MKNAVNLKYVLILLVTLLINFTNNLYSQNIESTVDSLLLEQFPPNGPGATFLIAKDGNVIYSKSFGLSNLELNTKMRTENVFEIGSMTKQFTAVSILMLVEQGKISLTDEITKFIPDYPINGQKITVHHLLNHTSGIKSYTSIKKLYSIDRNDLTLLELIDFFKNEPMDFNPGEKYKYNNSGYILLGYIIEKTSGLSYEDFISKNIYEKLNMKNSSYANHRKIIKNRASGYHKKETYQNSRYISYSLSHAAGVLMSTVGDLNIWQQALITNKLLKKETLQKAFTNYTLNNGEKINYGYGWKIKALENEPSYEHSGFIFGFKSMGVYLPKSNVYVVGLSNCDCNSPTKITRELAKLASRY